MMQALLAGVRARLIDDWHKATRFWSVRLHLAVLGFAALYELSPVLPAQIVALIPQHMQPGLLGIYAVLGLVTRLIKQKKPNG